jgi:hypothetical protein
MKLAEVHHRAGVEARLGRSAAARGRMVDLGAEREPLAELALEVPAEEAVVVVARGRPGST